MSRVVYSIECFEKKGDKIIKTISLPLSKRINYRKILEVWNKKQIIDGIKIDKKIKVKLEVRCNIDINIRRFDYFFSESYMET